MVSYNPYDPQMKDDPFPLYARLRAESPVHYVEEFDTWALSLFEDVWNAGQNSEVYRSPGPPLIQRRDPEVTLVGASMFGLNPPVHTEVRKALVRHYSPRGVAQLEAQIRETARASIAEALPKGRLDVISELGLRISVRVASLLIGLPLSDSELLSGIVRRIFTRVPGVEGQTPDGILAGAALGEYLYEAVCERRRRNGGEGDDAMGAFFRMQLDGRPLTDEEIGQHLNILVVGGTETLPKVFAGGILQLYRHPDQLADLVADPSLIKTAFTEIARYEMPTQFLTRMVAEDHELRGQKLRTGQGVMFLYRSANRDEREFPDPDRFDIHRRAERILSFGHGTHICLGQHAAKLEAKVMFEELLSAIPEYHIDESEVVPERSEFVAGYVSVPITFQPR
ncbi:MAG: cytochrome P450 [Myxococcales bacterium]|nr:cytochrome P450 [Myxococcales bacterium]